MKPWCMVYVSHQQYTQRWGLQTHSLLPLLFSKAGIKPLADWMVAPRETRPAEIPTGVGFPPIHRLAANLTLIWLLTASGHAHESPSKDGLE